MASTVTLIDWSFTGRSALGFGSSFASLRSLRHVYKTAEPAFLSKASSHCEKVLLRLVCPVAFDLPDGSVPGFACCTPLLSDFGHIRRHISAHQQPQTGLRNYVFVIVFRNKKQETCGTAHGNFFACQGPSHCDGIGK